MKKLFILSFMLCLLGGNSAWADYFRFTYNPQVNGDENNWVTENGPDLLVYYTNGGVNNYTNDNNREAEFDWYAVPQGVSLSSDCLQTGDGLSGSTCKLKNKQVKFKGKEGYILVYAYHRDALWNVDHFIASFCIYVVDPSYQVKVWDFNNHRLSNGWVDEDGSQLKFEESSLWKRETLSNSANGDIAFDAYKYINASDNNGQYGAFNERVMDTNGLFFNTQAEGFAVCNNSDHYTGGDQYKRFIAIARGSSFTIPGSWLQAGYRVRVLADKYGGLLNLNITNAKDIAGRDIKETYKIGGTPWNDPSHRFAGYYQFIVKESNTDMTFSVVGGNDDAQWMRIYRIEIYKGDFRTDNNVLGKYTVTNRINRPNTTTNDGLELNPVGENGDKGNYHLHYRSKGDPVYVKSVITTGNLNINTTDFVQTSGYNYEYQTKRGQYGAFKVGLVGTTHDSKYEVDYAERVVSVGTLHVMPHPYTWDFTNLKTYANMTKEEADATKDLNNWKRQEDGNWTFWYDRRNNEGTSVGAPFAFGSELYSGSQIFNEAIGLGFSPKGGIDNGSITITEKGLKIEDNISNDKLAGVDATSPNSYGTDANGEIVGKDANNNYYLESNENPGIFDTGEGIRNEACKVTRGWELTIPDIHYHGVVYIRVTTIPGKSPRIGFDYNRSNGGTALYGKWNVYKRIIDNGDGTKDIIFAHSPLLWSHRTHDFKILLNNVVVKKIATSIDQKLIGKTGYATESRDHAIDHRLTTYFMGEKKDEDKKDIEVKAFTAYLDGAEGNEDYTTAHFVELTKPLLGSSQGSNGGCILYRWVKGKNKTYVGFDSEGYFAGQGRCAFHLFAPAIHDIFTESSITNANFDNYKSIYSNSFVVDVNKVTNVNQLVNGKESKNILLSHLNGNDGYVSPNDNEGNTNYIFTSKSYKTYDATKINDHYNAESDCYEMVFVRVDPKGHEGKGATISDNCAYTHIPTAKLPELGVSNGKMNIVFDDFIGFEDVIGGIATGVSSVSREEEETPFYTLEGVAVKRPTQNGIYIRNGKKVIIK